MPLWEIWSALSETASWNYSEILKPASLVPMLNKKSLNKLFTPLKTQLSPSNKLLMMKSQEFIVNLSNILNQSINNIPPFWPISSTIWIIPVWTENAIKKPQLKLNKLSLSLLPWSWEKTNVIPNDYPYLLHEHWNRVNFV